ncbi:flippase [candidate division KSB1 bacterium]|nr:flippase [candidate division KSB1 bacterium]
MSSLKRLAENTGAMMIARGLQPFLNFILVVFISRWIGVDGLGEYTTIFSLIFVFQLICAFGLRMLLTREVAKYPEQTNRYLSNSLVLALAISCLSILVMVLVVYVLRYDASITLNASILSLSLIPTALDEIFIGILAGHERLKVVGLATIIEEAIKVSLCVLFLYLGHGILTVVIIYVILRFFSSALLYYFIRRFVMVMHFEFDLTFAINLLRQTKIFAYSSVLFALYLQIDVIILSKFGTIEDVGIYGASMRILRFLIMMVQSFFIAFYPILSKLYKEDKLKFDKACYSSGKYFLILTIPLAILTSLIFDKVVVLFFGADFRPSILVLQIIIWSIIPFAISKLLSFALLASDNQKADLWVNLISTIIKGVLLIVFVYFWGYIGISFGTLWAMFAMVLVQLFMSKSILPMTSNQIYMLFTKIIIANALMLASILLLRDINIFLAFIVSVGVYLFSLYKLNVFSGRDKYFVQLLIKRKADQVMTSNS